MRPDSWPHRFGIAVPPLLAPVSGAMMSRRRPQLRRGTAVAGVFSPRYLNLAFPLGGSRYDPCGRHGADSPHGSFFHATGGSVMRPGERLKHAGETLWVSHYLLFLPDVRFLCFCRIIPMKIVIALDLFKESRPVMAVAEAIEKGFREIYPDADYVKKCPWRMAGKRNRTINGGRPAAGVMSTRPAPAWATGGRALGNAGR